MLKIVDNDNIIRIMRDETQVCIFFFDEAQEFRRAMMEWLKAPLESMLARCKCSTSTEKRKEV